MVDDMVAFKRIARFSAWCEGHCLSAALEPLSASETVPYNAVVPFRIAPKYQPVRPRTRLTLLRPSIPPDLYAELLVLKSVLRLSAAATGGGYPAGLGEGDAEGARLQGRGRQPHTGQNPPLLPRSLALETSHRFERRAHQINRSVDRPHRWRPTLRRPESTCWCRCHSRGWSAPLASRWSSSRSEKRPHCVSLVWCRLNQQAFLF